MDARKTVGRFGKNLMVSAIGALVLIGAVPARAGARRSLARHHRNRIRAKPQRAPQAQVARCTSNTSHAANRARAAMQPVWDSSRVAARAARRPEDVSLRRSERERR